ncbi:DUF6879 family protein [Nonomuraea sp. NPDC004702]
MHITSEDFGELFSSYQREAFRLETLDTYTIPEERLSFRDFLAGKAQPEAHKNDPWVDVVKGNIDSGKRMYRVHIAKRPLSDYLRYEMAWGYHRNQQAGEECYVLDITNRHNPLDGVPDFWMFDSAIVVIMQYDIVGAFLGAELASPGDLNKYVSYRDAAISNAQSFKEFWERYKQR